MIIYESLDDLHIKLPVCLALGNFDGLHPGHRMLIERCVSIAKSRGWAPAVFTFNGLTANGVGGSGRVKQLLPAGEKARLLEEMGIRMMISVPFTKELMELSPSEFIDRLAFAVDLRCTVCGFNFRFGYRAAGTSSFLAGMGMAYGFEAITVPDVRYKGETVSSTLLRKLLESGDLSAYEEVCGSPFCLTSEVLKLKAMEDGEEIYMIDPAQALPKDGVYRVILSSEGVSRELSSEILESGEGEERLIKLRGFGITDSPDFRLAFPKQ